MSNGDVGQELAAIKQVIDALQALSPEGRDRVINYVFQTLGISTNVALIQPSASPAVVADINAQPMPALPLVHEKSNRAISDIRSVKEQKQPHTANEMAAVLAYYLSELAPHDSRKSEITAADVDKYFKQAGFPLPAVARFTLQNAKNAGYLDSGSARGSYKLNPVGHNLVAHNLPSSETNNSSSTPKARRKKATRPKQKAKSPPKKIVKKKNPRK